MENPLDFGIVITDEDGRVERFLEKPTWGQVFSDRINTGIYVLDPAVLDHIAPNRSVDFSADVFPELLEAGQPLYGFTTEGYWEDVGTLEAYMQAHADILDGKVAVGIDAFPLRDGVWVGEGAEIDPSALIEAPALIGDNCRVGPARSCRRLHGPRRQRARRREGRSSSAASCTTTAISAPGRRCGVPSSGAHVSCAAE